MKKLLPLSFILAILVIGTACQAGSSQPDVVPTLTFTVLADTSTPEAPGAEPDAPAAEVEDTPAPEPTETLTETPTETPTDTPEPTETPNTEITPTETIPATPDPNQGLGGLRYEDRFDGSSGWGWGYFEDAVTFSLDAGGVLAAFQEANQGWRISLGPDGVIVGNQQVLLKALPEVCSEKDEFGLLYRGTFTENNQFNGYVFKLNCAGQAKVDRLEDNDGTTLLGWTAVEGLDAVAGSEITFLVWAGGEEMRFYVNDTYVGAVSDSTYKSGQYGIFAQDRTNGNALFLFTSLQVFDVTPE
jgi:hypothetical protein